MTSRTSNPASGDPSNPWEEYAKFYEACEAVVSRVELRADQSIALTGSEQAELRTMVLNLGVLGRSLPGRKSQEMNDLAGRAQRAMARCMQPAAAVSIDGEEPEQDPAVVAS